MRRDRNSCEIKNSSFVCYLDMELKRMEMIEKLRLLSKTSFLASR